MIEMQWGKHRFIGPFRLELKEFRHVRVEGPNLGGMPWNILPICERAVVMSCRQEVMAETVSVKIATASKMRRDRFEDRQGLLVIEYRWSERIRTDRWWYRHTSGLQRCVGVPMPIYKHWQCGSIVGTLNVAAARISVPEQSRTFT